MSAIKDINIQILSIDEHNCELINSFESIYQVQGHMALYMDQGAVQYHIIESEPYEKTYEDETLDPNQFIHSERKMIYFAFANEELVGQIILTENWNKYGFIEDIRVHKDYKGQGIGKSLMLKAKEWCESRNLGGLTLETQTNNVAACQFYEKCGFVIGGFDGFVYKQIKKVQTETALYWYWIFE